jgi:pimeloyl-ACP methyl ester carboxylesterase
MPSFTHDGVTLDYIDEGAGDPVVLVHGFGSNKEMNWVGPSWTSALKRAGYRAIALDNRGHGGSTKFYDPSDYDLPEMAGDVVALMDHLGIPRADLIGYSMGARIVGYTTVAHPERVRSAVLGGIGERFVDGPPGRPVIAEALEAPSLDDVTDPVGRMFRKFAEQTKSDLRALAACIRGERKVISKEQAASLRAPVLIAVGTEDEIAGSGEALAKLIPGSRLLAIPGRDHNRAVGDPAFKQGVLEFLARRP